MNPNQENIDSLRAIADYLEANPQMPFLDFRYVSAYVYYWDLPGEGAKEDRVRKFLASIARCPGTWTKSNDDHYFELLQEFGKLQLRVLTDRANVCRNVTVTKEVEVEEWDCSPLLEEAQEVA